VLLATSGLLLAAGLGIACRGGGEGRSGPPTTTPPPSASVAALDAGPPKLGELPVLAVVLNDPRAQVAREKWKLKDPSGAARALDDAAAAANLDPHAQASWAYVSGRLHVEAEESEAAEAAFDKAALDADLAPYAQLRASQAYARAGKMGLALARAEAASGRTKLSDEEAVALGEARMATGDRPGAESAWREMIKAHPHGSRWVDTSLRLASALLEDTGAPGTDRDAALGLAKEALVLSTRVETDAPKVADSGALVAHGIRAHAVAVVRALGGTAHEELSTAEKIKRAQGWLDEGDAEQAWKDLARLTPPAKAKEDATDGDACALGSLRGQIAAKLHGKARARVGVVEDPWADATASCHGESTLAPALYAEGKSLLAAKRVPEALDRWGELETQFPDNHLSDDARFQAALQVQSGGDEERAYAMFLSLDGAYPKGDMTREALFRAALIKMVHGDWEAAKAPLDRAVALDTHDRHWATAERAVYFRARAAEATGDVAAAKEGYRTVLEGAPLSFYMTQAYDRLHTLDAKGAEQALEAAKAREPQGSFPQRQHAETKSPEFVRAVRLLEVGEMEAAKREFAASGATAEGADPELTWIVAWLYDASGSPELGHAFARGKLTDFLGHYPVGVWRVPWEVAFPRAYGPDVESAAHTSGIPAALVWAIMREESDFHPEAKSGASAYGLMQLVEGTARMVGKGLGLPTDVASLNRPEVSIALGSTLLGQLRGQFAKDPALAIAAYNSGGGAVGRWLGQRRGADFDLFVEQIPYDETRNYEKRVLASEAAYGFLYDPPALGETLAIPLTVP
jgi:soluble lytic murein transglycosylase